MNRCAIGLLPCVRSLRASPDPGRAQALDRAVKEQMGADEEARASQARIDQLDDQTQKMLGDYRRARRCRELRRPTRSSSTAQVASQNDELARHRAAARRGRHDLARGCCR